MHRRLNLWTLLPVATLCGTLAHCESLSAAEQLRALIVDGQNNHQWKVTTPILKEMLTASGRFRVEVATSPPAKHDLSGFRPRFAEFDVVVSNYNGEPWPAATREDFESYVRGGGGFVSVHAANNSFPDWSEYNEMIGLGGWYGRDQTHGPYVFIRDGKVVRDTSPGPGGHHGQQHEFQVETRDGEHPIMRGLPDTWLHTRDELYDKLRGPARNMQILATAYADPAQGGSGRIEPMLMALEYGQGRIFHTVLGHADYSMRCVGFITTLTRGAEWAATGEVTLPVPRDFPTADATSVPQARVAQPWVEYAGKTGPGAGQHIVLVSGDEEYRSEEALPQLGKILAHHHGFRCTVLFAIDPKDGTIDPKNQQNIPGLEALSDADLMIIATRFRNLPEEQMKHIVSYVDSGRPIIGLRTATHAFKIPAGKPFSHYSFDSHEWPQGFGRQVLGETWVSHHGHHGRESTRGIVAPEMREHPIVRGIEDGDVWGPTDVYGVRLDQWPDSCQPLVYGEVLQGMQPDDPPVAGEKNDPMMPIAWINRFTSKSGDVARIFTTTMGASQDLANEGLRRLLVNAAYWCLSLESVLPTRVEVDLVGDYQPTPFGFGSFRQGVRPSDHQ